MPFFKEIKIKYLSDYMQDAQTKCFEENGAFFAFSSSQLNEKKVEDVVYVNVGSGLICPKENGKKLLKELEDIVTAGIAQDIKENGYENIIKRELNNYECYYVGEIDDAVDALSSYEEITTDMIVKVFQGGSCND